MGIPKLNTAQPRVAPVVAGADSAPVDFVLNAPSTASGIYTITSKAQLTAWMLSTSGGWTGTLGITVAPAGSSTFLPVVLKDTRMFLFTQLGMTPLEFYELGLQVRVEAGSDFSGNVTGRLG